MNFNEIVNKYNYDTYLAQFLYILYEELVNYFGEEQRNIIFEAFLNCPVISFSNCYDGLNELGFSDGEDDVQLVDADSLKRATGVYASQPDIVYDEKTKSFNISNIKRVVAINNLDLNKEYIKATIIHEVAHLIKSYYNEYQIDGNILIEKSGLIERKYVLSFDGKQVKKKCISEMGVGLEEGFTSIVEEQIAKIMVNPDYKVSGYGVVNTIAHRLTDNSDNLFKIIIAQIYKDKGELVEIYGEEYYNLEEIVDKIYDYNLKMFSAIFNNDLFNKYSVELNDYITTQFLPLMQILETNNKKSKESS